MPDSTASWTSRLWQAVVVLLAAAVGARVVWELLEPLIPVLLLAAGIVAVLGLAGGRRGK